MNKIIITLLLLLSFTGCQKKQNLEIATIKASSMVCNTCAKTIEKAVYRVEGVKEVNVDVDKKLVEVKFVSLQTNVEFIESAITEAGYDANDKKRNPDAYEKLDACCKIDK
jgi:copper ion binding protein